VIAEVSGGRVYILGAGPGDPGLLTLRAAAVLAAADVVYHDQLVSSEVLDMARAGSELVDIGHRAGRERRDIPATCSAMAAAARRGLVVARLKGGDPFLFGRGAEEIEALLREGVSLEVVAGVSSALAAPLAAGIPVTHRGVSASVAIVTGHGRNDDYALDWKSLRADTVVVMMAYGRLPVVTQELIAAGWPPSTPAAVVMAATTPRQRQVTAQLAQIAEAVGTAQLGAPSILVVGEVVAIGTRLSEGLLSVVGSAAGASE
jgi:uroporphyrin-III C-methyltransferase